MRSSRWLSIVVLIILGVSFAGANIWFAAARSTIPLGLEGRVTHTERLLEKIPGVDDVYFVTLDLDRRVQVDRPVFEAVAVNQSVKKQAWSKIIEIDGKKVALEWSPDFRGMFWAMPLTVAVCVYLGVIAVGHPLPTADEVSDARETSAATVVNSNSTPQSP